MKTIEEFIKLEFKDFFQNLELENFVLSEFYNKIVDFKFYSYIC